MEQGLINLYNHDITNIQILVLRYEAPSQHTELNIRDMFYKLLTSSVYSMLNIQRAKGAVQNKNLKSQWTCPLRPLAPSPPQALTGIMNKNVFSSLCIQRNEKFQKMSIIIPPPTKTYIFLEDKGFAPPPRHTYLYTFNYLCNT